MYFFSLNLKDLGSVINKKQPNRKKSLSYMNLRWMRIETPQVQGSHRLFAGQY